MAINERDELAGLHAYVPGRSVDSVKEEYGLSDVVKLASNENPFGPPLSSVLCETSHHYPDQYHHDLYSQLCSQHQGAKENIVLGNGSDDILQLVALAFLRSTDHVIFSETTFSVYDHVSKLMGASISRVPLKNYTTHLDGILEAITDSTKVIFIANPNNPTGTFCSTDALTSFLKQCPNHVLVVLDEAYRHFVTDEAISQSETLLTRFSNVCILRTFSKAYGIAGFRVGYALSSPEVIGALEKVRLPFNVNTPALDAASLVLKNHSYLERTLENNASEKCYMVQELEKLGLTVLPTQANFVCILGSFDANHCATALMKQGMIIRSLTSFGLTNAIRVTIGLPEENRKFINKLKDYLNE